MFSSDQKLNLQRKTPTSVSCNLAAETQSPDPEIALALEKAMTSSISLPHYLKMICITNWEPVRKLVLYGFQKLLADGDNPNQQDEQGLTPLWWIIVYFDIDFLARALAYRANPFETPKRRHMVSAANPWGFDPKPVIEYTNIIGRYEKYDFIVRMCTKPERPLSSHKLMKIISFTIKKTQDKKIHVHFEANTQAPIGIVICQTDQLSGIEIEKIYTQYQKYFKGSPTLAGTLNNFFKHEIAGSNKIIELIYCGTELIGMNLHKLTEDPENSAYLFWYLSCIYMVESFRGLGLTDPLAMSLPHVMPKLFKKPIIGVIQSICLESAKLVDGLDYFPHYQPSFLMPVAEKIFPHIQEVSDSDPAPYLVNRPGECWSELPVAVNVSDSKNGIKESLAALRYNLMRGISIFHKEAKEEINKNSHYGVLLLFFIDEQSWKKYFSACLTMNLDAGKFINDLAENFLKLIPNMKPQFDKNAIALPTHKLLFKHNILKASNVVIPAKEDKSTRPLLRSKL